MNPGTSTNDLCMEIVLNGRMASGILRDMSCRTGPDRPEVEPGFKEFLNDSSLSGTAQAEENRAF